MQAITRCALRLARRKGPIYLFTPKELQLHIFNLRQSLSTSSSATNPINAGVPSPRSTQMRGLSYVLISAVGGLSAWYAFRENPIARSLVSTTSGWSNARNFVTGAGGGIASNQKRVVVVNNDEIFTGVADEETLTKSSMDSGRKVIELMDSEQVTERLRRNEESWLNGRGKGVVRYDVVQIPSNDPIEDDHIESIIEMPSRSSTDAASDWSFWGVFDGHSGWTTSATLRQRLIPFVVRELNALTDTASNASAVDSAIKTGFTRLDNEIVHASVEKAFKDGTKASAAKTLAPALSGSCALLSFFDSKTQTLRVACTGDSRAVLGRKTGAAGNWTAQPLSTDQTGSNPDEVARMRREHPGEPGVISAGRVLGGLEPSRAFGDAVYKWSNDIQSRLRKSFFTRSARATLRSPPYVTAEPEVTTTRIEPGRGDFVVLATDGLWEMLTNEEVVGLVGWWLEEERKRSLRSSTSSSFLSPGGGSSWLNRLLGRDGTPHLPVDKPAASPNAPKGESETMNAQGQKRPIRQDQWDLNTTTPDKDRFVCEDRNVATHLVRNALGGKNGDTLAALLTLPSPHSRRYRDDLTVSVVFFGDGEAIDVQGVGPDRMLRNLEASAKTPVVEEKALSDVVADLKAKL